MVIRKQSKGDGRSIDVHPNVKKRKRKGKKRGKLCDFVDDKARFGKLESVLCALCVWFLFCFALLKAREFLQD